MSQLEPAEGPSTKRLKASAQDAASLLLDSINTPGLATLSAPSSPNCGPRASLDSYLSPLNSNRQIEDVSFLAPSLGDLSGENSDGGARIISAKEGASRDDEAWGSDEDELGDANDVFRVSPAGPSERRKRNCYPPQEKRGEQVHLTRHSATQSSGSQTSYRKAKARHITHQPNSTKKAYQITDLTLSHILKSLSIVTAIIHFNESGLSLNALTLDQNILGDGVKVIRMIQLSPDAWMLLGYRCNDSALFADSREGSSLLDTEWTTKPYNNASSHGNEQLDDADGDEEFDTNERSTDEYRTRRVPWLQSEDERLLAYRDRMNMEWKEIFKRFLRRTPAAIRTRYNVLHRR